MEIRRRDFMRVSASATAAALWANATAVAEERNGIPYRTLGRTGEKVSLLGLGGNHLDGRHGGDEAACIRVIRMAVDEGINFLDNARSYNDGVAERFMGKALRDGYRDKVFLMSKSRKRNGREARAELEETLRNFGVDHIDLWQVHAIESEVDIENAYAEDGVLPVAIKAREEGLVRYIGFSGHDYPAVHASMIDHGHPWDTVQMPLNPMDYHHELSFEKVVVPKAVEQNIGILAMKTNGGGQILESQSASAEDCQRYAMSLPTATVIRGMPTVEILKKNLEIARNFKPLSEAEMNAMRSRTEREGRTGKAGGIQSGYLAVAPAWSCGPGGKQACPVRGFCF